MVNYWNKEQVKLMLSDFMSAMLAEKVVSLQRPINRFNSFLDEWVEMHFFFDEDEKKQGGDNGSRASDNDKR